MDTSNKPPQISVNDAGADSNHVADYAPLRVRTYESGDNEGEADDLASSSEISDSASDELAAFSDTDCDTLIGPSEESPVLNSTLNTALMKFNQLNSGIASLDTSVLNKCTSEEKFRFCMMRIAISNNLSLDDDEVHDILNTLLPLIKARSKQTMETTLDLTDGTSGMPKAKLTDEDDFYHAEKSDGGNVDLIRDTSHSELPRKAKVPHSAKDLPVSEPVDDTTQVKESPGVLLQRALYELPAMAEKYFPSVEMGHDIKNFDNLHSRSISSDENCVELEQLSSAGEALVSQPPVAGNILNTYKHVHQSAAEKDEKSANLDRQIPVSVASTWESQQEASTMASAKDRDCEDKKQVSKGQDAVNMKQRSKQLTITSSSKPCNTHDYCLHARPAGWGNIISFMESGIIFSKANNLAKVIDTTGKLQVLRLKLFCLAIRLHQSTNHVLKQVLYRLDLADHLRGGRGSRESDLETLRLLAQDLEARRMDCLEFECKILVLGRSGVGKSATINSLFGRVKSKTSAFKPETKEVKEISGLVNGLKIRVIDTPGFLSSCEDMQYNLKVLSSIKHHIKESPPDVILYVDRLDLQCMDYGESLLFKAISDRLGRAMWCDTIVVFTHGLSVPLYDTHDSAKHYEMFVGQRLRMLQRSICEAAGDPQIRNLHAIVENHVTGQRNGENRYFHSGIELWRSQVLLLCFASKILAEADKLLRSEGHSFWSRPKAPSLSFLLALMFQSRVQLKLHNEEVIGRNESRSDGNAIHSDDQSSCEAMPIFTRLARELRSLYKRQRRLSHGEIKYKRKLFMKKGLIQTCARFQGMERGLALFPEEDGEIIHSDALAISVHDRILPHSGNYTYSYGHMETRNGMLLQAIQSKLCWDKDIGYDGLSVKKAFLAFNKLPLSISMQIIKDEKDTNIQMGCAVLLERSRTGAGLALIPQTLKDNVVYNLYEVMTLSNFVKHMHTCGLAVTMIGGNSHAGIKLQDCLVLNKWPEVAMGGGGIIAQQEVTYGGGVGISLEGKHSSLSPSAPTVGISILSSREELAICGNFQIQLLLGQTIVVAQASLNNVRSGQMRIRVSSSNQLHMALIGLLPLLGVLISNRIGGMNS